MLDIRFVRENPEVVKKNIRNKFQDNKLPLVDEVIELDKRNREIKQEVEGLRAERNKISKMIGGLMKEGKKDEAEEAKKKVTANAQRVEALSSEEKEVEEKIKKINSQHYRSFCSYWKRRQRKCRSSEIWRAGSS